MFDITFHPQSVNRVGHESKRFIQLAQGKSELVHFEGLARMREQLLYGVLSFLLSESPPEPGYFIAIVPIGLKFFENLGGYLNVAAFKGCASFFDPWARM